MAALRIGLVDVDSRHFPNFALMKLSAWHKARGDAVEWWNGFTHYDRVYLSKVFTFTPDHDTVIDADEIVTGGTGYKDYGSLPPEVEKMFPDYSIYPQYHQAIGFLTRGCCRRCEWCIVPRKEGSIRPAATWEQLKRPDSRELVLMDNNVLACGHGLEQIERMGREAVWVDFNQGLDARLIGPDTAALLAKLKWIRFVRLSCDTSAMVPVIEQAAAYLKEAGVAPSRLWCYLLVRDVADAHKRVLALEKLGFDVFAQPYRDYDGGEPTAEQRAFARWVNVKSVYRSCAWEDYVHYPHKNRASISVGCAK